jgi:hypothetical protein
VELIRRINPSSILDIGAGFGRWGILGREFLEIWDSGNYSDKWNVRIDAVEIFEEYLKPYHSYFYDNVFTEDAVRFIKDCKEKYDLIICGDVIEHFERETADKFIEDCLKKCSYLMINIPTGKNWEQGEINGNKFEIHRSTWRNADFRKYPHIKIKKFRDYISRKFSVVLISNDKIDLKSEYKKKYGRHFFKKNILENRLGLGWMVRLFKKSK